MFSIFQTPSHQKAPNIILYIYLKMYTSHDGKLTKKLVIALIAFVFGHISNHILLNITKTPYNCKATKY